MNSKLLAALAVCATLTACANTVAELKTDKASFDGVAESPQSYAATYRVLRTAARQCMEHQPWGTPVTVEGELDSDLKEGQIRQRVTGQAVLLTTTVIDVKAGAGDRGVVTLYTVKGSLGQGINIPTMTEIKRWITGDTSCTKN